VRPYAAAPPRGFASRVARSRPRARHHRGVPELRHLRYFLAVAEELSFTRAAERLHMAPSPLSAAIRALEAELGVELFVRTTRSVELTDAGRRLLSDGAAALAAVDGAFANAARAGRGVLGTLRLGSSPAARHEIRPALLARLRAEHPGIEVDASEATTGNLCRELLSRRLDVAIGFCAEPVPGLARRRVSDEPAWVVARRPWRSLRDCRFVVPPPDLNAGFHRRLERLLGFTPATVIANFIWDEAEWPAGDDVVALATERVARHWDGYAAALAPAAALPLELIWREDDDSPLLRTFLENAGSMSWMSGPMESA
jgi:DNA-binding transcriptional LysR family regulator